MADVTDEMVKCPLGCKPRKKGKRDYYFSHQIWYSNHACKKGHQNLKGRFEKIIDDSNDDTLVDELARQLYEEKKLWQACVVRFGPVTVWPDVRSTYVSLPPPSLPSPSPPPPTALPPPPPPPPPEIRTRLIDRGHGPAGVDQLLSFADEQQITIQQLARLHGDTEEAENHPILKRLVSRIILKDLVQLLSPPN